MKDVVGKTFNRLTVLHDVERTDRLVRRVKCLCSCGSVTEKNLKDILNHNTKSCGCLAKESSRDKSNKHKNHGYCGTAVYKAWKSMRDRCLCEQNTAWSKYGGRGITICNEWGDFLCFLADMGDKPFPKAQIDRINNNGNYTPENCRWTTAKQNTRNRSCTLYATHNNETLSLGEWGERIGISAATLKDRKYAGWSDERIMTTPIGISGKKSTG